MPTSATRRRTGKSYVPGTVYDAPVDTGLHSRISDILGERPEYPS
jgi:hypothetical protein